MIIAPQQLDTCSKLVCANLATCPKTLFSGGCGPNRIVYKPHPLHEDWRFRVRNCLNTSLDLPTTSLMQLVHMQFSLMSMQPSSAVSKVQLLFLTPDHNSHYWRYEKGITRTITVAFLDIHITKWTYP